MATEELLGADDVEAAPLPTDEILGKIARYATRHRELTEEIEAAENALKVKQLELRTIEETQLPEALQSIGMESFTMKDGFVIKLTKMVNAGIPVGAPPDQREAAFQWLRDNNAGDLIKRTVTLAFGKGEDLDAQKLVDTAAQLFPNHIPDDKQSVHAKTLSVWVAERLEGGLPVAEALLGVYVKHYAKITPPKAPRAKKAKA